MYLASGLMARGRQPLQPVSEVALDAPMWAFLGHSEFYYKKSVRCAYCRLRSTYSLEQNFCWNMAVSVTYRSQDKN